MSQFLEDVILNNFCTVMLPLIKRRKPIVRNDVLNRKRSKSGNILSICMYLAFLLLQRNLETYLRLTLNRPRNLEAFEGKTRLNFAVIHAGAPCCGMNAGKNVRFCLHPRQCILLSSFNFLSDLIPNTFFYLTEKFDTHILTRGVCLITAPK